MAILDVINVKKNYTTRFGGARVEALRDVSFTVEQGAYVAIMGSPAREKQHSLIFWRGWISPPAAAPKTCRADWRRWRLTACRARALCFTWM